LCQDCQMSSIQSFYGPLFAISSTLTCSFSGNVPLPHTSTQHSSMSLHVKFARPSPALVMQATSATARRPRYEAKSPTSYSRATPVTSFFDHNQKLEVEVALFPGLPRFFFFGFAFTIINWKQKSGKKLVRIGRKSSRK